MWTIEKRIGMFTPDSEEINPLALSENYDSTCPALNAGPHDVWLEFLINRFKAVKYYNKVQVNITNVFSSCRPYDL